MKEKVKLLKALADETRIRILQCLLTGEHCACSVVPFVGKAQPTVSQHLRILVEAGILASRRDGVNIWYTITSKETMRILAILKIEERQIKEMC